MKIYTERQLRRAVEERMIELEKNRALSDDIGRALRRLEDLEWRMRRIEDKVDFLYGKYEPTKEAVTTCEQR